MVIEICSTPSTGSIRSAWLSPVRPVLEIRFTERVVEGGLSISDRGNRRANLLRLPQGLGLRKQPTNSRLLQPLKALTFKVTPLLRRFSSTISAFRWITHSR